MKGKKEYKERKSGMEKKENKGKRECSGKCGDVERVYWSDEMVSKLLKHLSR